jgi:hypothetical protein
MIPIPVINQTLSGAILLGFWVAGLFFFRFWKLTRDRLFSIFALAFWVMGLERLILTIMTPENEFRPYIYLFRLLAFTLLAAAIIDKNRKG